MDARLLALVDVDSPLSAAAELTGCLVNGKAGRKSHSLRSLSNIMRLRSAMLEFEVVHVHLFPAQLWAAIAFATLPRKKRPLLLTTEHNTHNRRRKRWYRAVDRAMYGAYDQVITISEATAAALTEWVPELAPRITTIPNGIDYVRFSSAPPLPRSSVLPREIPADAPVLLCAGRLSEQKDQATAIRALKLLPHTHLCLAGTGELIVPLKELTRELGLEDRVHFLGRRDDLPSLLQVIDIYIQPSRWEGFGLAVAEAMAAGKPVVCSDVPGMREVVADSGICFAAGNETALAEAIRSLQDDPVQARQLSAQAKQRAKMFTLDKFTARHKLLYERLSGKSGWVRYKR